MSDLERASELLRTAGLTLGLAESCTGGLLCSSLTDVPGSSAYLRGGVVAYADEVKRKLLGVKPETLLQHGAVSDPVALAMAKGARKLFDADVGIGITGITGPGGGTAEKPVGLVYLALVARDQERCERCVWYGDREQNKAQSVEAALRLIQSYVEQHV